MKSMRAIVYVSTELSISVLSNVMQYIEITPCGAGCGQRNSLGINIYKLTESVDGDDALLRSLPARAFRKYPKEARLSQGD